MWLVLWLAFLVWLEDVGSEPHTSNVGKILEAFQHFSTIQVFWRRRFDLWSRQALTDLTDRSLPQEHVRRHLV